jgi:riboflavin kinase/FMN adenylyltransferase
MRIIRDYTFVNPEDRGASAAIGNFDGVHLGHRAVIDIARDAGKAIGAPCGVLTFDPHPRAYFAPQADPFRLMGPAAKATELAKIGVERLYQLNFNAALAALTPEEFATRVIHEGLGLKHVVVGADFCFGQGRAGKSADLQKFGDAELIEGTQGQVSSTRIRQALADGKPRDAASMLGHWHRIEGMVIGGEQRGRELGYPTANMSIDGLHPPRFGVYAVLVEVQDGPHAGKYHGVASMGVRPMFGENRPNLETFIFDFTGDLYGSTLSIALVEYLRGEEKFDGLDALITQMDADSVKSRAILAAL